MSIENPRAVEKQSPANPSRRDNPVNDQADVLLRSSTKWLRGNQNPANEQLVKDNLLPSVSMNTPEDFGRARKYGDEAREGLGARAEAANGTANQDRARILGRMRETNEIETLYKDVRGIVIGNSGIRAKDRMTVDQLTLVHKRLSESNDPADKAKAEKLDQFKQLWLSGKLTDFQTPGTGEPGGSGISLSSFNKGKEVRQDADKKELEKLGKDVRKVQDMDEAKSKLDDRSKILADADKPTDEFLKRAKIEKGDGYYQVATKLLHVDKNNRPTHKEIMALTRHLQELLKDGAGNIPAVLDMRKMKSLVTSENFQLLMSNIMKKSSDRKAAAGE